LKAVIKALLRAVFREYELNRIYRKPIDRQPAIDAPAGTRIAPLRSKEQVATSPDPRIRSHDWYHGEHARGWGLWEGDRLLCITWFWTPRDTRAQRDFPFMAADEAVMVDLLTAPECRGRNYAPAITRHAEQSLADEGFRRVWTWVWHSNTPSQRVFEKSGWTYDHFLAVFSLRGIDRPLRVRLPASLGL
jgi:ribosomal protein S18 acetylase RimI-like enzyme